jgi:O-antigen/teichoic acid export membrane protein
VGPSVDETDRLALGARGLRQHTARGTLINGAYLTGVYSLNLARGFVVAALLPVSDYSIWGIVAIALAVILQLKQVGIGDKYVQQAEEDQETAFQRAFTLELGVTGVFAVLMVAIMPLVALAYGRWEVVAPGAVLALAPLGAALQAPVWVFYRRMDFVRQRRLQAVDPLIAFAVTVALAVAGAGYWSLVVGTVAGAWAGAAVALASCPYRLRLRFDRGSAREYLRFSWPLFAAGLTPIVMAQGSVLAGEHTIGLAAVGIIVLAASIADYTNRVDAILTETLYPAICALRDRTALLLETFVKSNRLALMWGVPFGVGIALFAGDLVHFVLGRKWDGAIGLIRAFGLIAALNHVAFNWDAFYRARGDTRPIAVWSAWVLGAFLAAALPLLVLEGLDGFAWGMGAMTLVSLVVRGVYLKRLFGDLRLARHALRAIAPTVPAAAAILAERAATTGARTGTTALVEVVGYVLITVAATALLEAPLLREVAGYLRGRGGPAAPVAAPPTRAA